MTRSQSAAALVAFIGALACACSASEPRPPDESLGTRKGALESDSLPDVYEPPPREIPPPSCEVVYLDGGIYGKMTYVDLDSCPKLVWGKSVCQMMASNGYDDIRIPYKIVWRKKYDCSGKLLEEKTYE